MAANDLDLTYSDIQKYVGTKLLWSRTPAAWKTEQTADFALALKRGLRKVYYNAVLPGETQPHTWSFMQPLGNVNLVTSVKGSDFTSDNSLTGTSGDNTVTIGDGSHYPSWVLAADLWVDGHRYEVIDQSVADELEVQQPGGGALLTTFNTTSWTLLRHYYALPDDFAGMLSSSLTYRRDQTVLGQIPLVNEQDIRRNDDDGTTGAPKWAAVVPLNYRLNIITGTGFRDTSEPTRYGLIFSPYTDSTYSVEFRYTAIPPLLEGSNHVYHWGGAPISEAILAAVADEAMKLVRDSNELEQDYLVALHTAIKQDRKLHPVHTYGQGHYSMGRTSYQYGPKTLAGHLDYKRRRTPYANITFGNW